MKLFGLTQDGEWIGPPKDASTSLFDFYDNPEPNHIYLGTEPTMFGFARMLETKYGIQNLKLKEFVQKQ